jgi:NAD+ diphosphatase
MRCELCGLSAYPRVAPAIITLVHRGEELLLARNGGFRGRMFSVLAGFVEPGETLEDTVHREIGEEVGVRLHPPRYVASQPWPFPHSLMVGFTAEWAEGEIEVDGKEIVEAGWYRKDRLPELPAPLSIARRLIDGWLAGR